MLFFGTDRFSIICLKSLLEKQNSLIQELLVVTPPDNPRARESEQRQVPLKVFCKDIQIPTVDAPRGTLRGWEAPKMSTGEPYDLGIVVSFGYFLPKRIVESFPNGAVNVHPSLLPKYRGASPIQHAILNGDLHTGVSIIELSVDKFDAGRILNQTKFDIPKDVLFDDLHDSLAKLGASALVETIKSLEEHKQTAQVQDNSLVKHAPKIPKEMAHIKWEQYTKHNLYALHRAIGSKTPLVTLFRGKLCHLMNIESPESLVDETVIHQLDHFKISPPGTLVYVKSQKIIYVRCIDGWLGVRDIHMHGKRTQAADSFQNGYQIVNGVDHFKSLE